MTLKSAFEYGKEQLSEVGIQESTIDAWYLLEYITRINRAQYFGNPDSNMEEEQWLMYQAVIEERKRRIPLQHITGVQEFMGFVFQVNEHVLIPRQDTEILVEAALNFIPTNGKSLENEAGMKVLDMCTGSGCILISLMKMRDYIIGTGVDISEDALSVARGNGELNQVSCTWMQSDLFANIKDRYQLIVSNPPYIRTSVIEELEAEVKLHDPMLALDGMEDGLYFYRSIIEQSKAFLEPGGVLLFEIGHDQGEEVSEYMSQYGFVDVVIKKDLVGLDRVVYGHVQ